MSRSILALACVACAGAGRMKSDMVHLQQPSDPSLVLADLILAIGPARDRVYRQSTPQMSHFSNIKTRFYRKDVLAKSLKELGYSPLIAENDNSLLVRGYKGNEEKAQIVIERDSKHDIGFKHNGQEFELVSDLQFWTEATPVDAFLEKLTQRYALNTILDTAKEAKFNIQEIQEDVTGKVTMKLEGYVQ